MPKTVNDSENWIVLEKQGPVPFHSTFVEYLPCVIRWAGHWSIQIWKNHTKHKESFPANTVFSYTQTSLVMFKLWYKICHVILIQKYKRLNNFTCCTCFLFTLKYLFIYLFVCLLLFKYSCLYFPATTFPHPTLHPSRLRFCPWVLYTCFLMTLPLLSPVISPHPPPPVPVTVSLFFISMSLVILCLLICLFD